MVWNCRWTKSVSFWQWFPLFIIASSSFITWNILNISSLQTACGMHLLDCQQSKEIRNSKLKTNTGKHFRDKQTFVDEYRANMVFKSNKQYHHKCWDISAWVNRSSLVWARKICYLAIIFFKCCWFTKFFKFKTNLNCNRWKCSKS